MSFLWQILWKKLELKTTLAHSWKKKKEQSEHNDVEPEKDMCSPSSSEIMDYSHDRAETNLDERGTDSTNVTPEINLDYSDEENSDLQSDECDTDLFLWKDKY